MIGARPVVVVVPQRLRHHHVRREHWTAVVVVVAAAVRAGLLAIEERLALLLVPVRGERGWVGGDHHAEGDRVEGLHLLRRFGTNARHLPGERGVTLLKHWVVVAAELGAASDPGKKPAARRQQQQGEAIEVGHEISDSRFQNMQSFAAPRAFMLQGESQTINVTAPPFLKYMYTPSYLLSPPRNHCEYSV